VAEGGDTPQDKISWTHKTESHLTPVSMRKCIQSPSQVNTDVLDVQTKKKHTSKKKQNKKTTK
jgi:hypothetical protein